MKKTLFFLTISLISSLIYSQNYNNGRVLYKVSSFIETNQPNPDAKDKKIDQAISNEALNQEFELIFNSNQSSFKYLNNINKDDNKVNEILKKLARSKYGSSFDFYLNLKTNETYTVNLDNVIIKENLKKIEWDLTNETKQIDNFLCYKATYKKEFTGRNGTKKNRIIEAWYCPKLPYSYGPKEFNGLPGLILELTESGTTLKAVKIEFYDNENEINIPKGKYFTREEYEKLIMDKI